MFKLEIETSNAAFEENPERGIAEILAMVAQQLIDGHREKSIKDDNGNQVGNWRLESDD